MASDAPRREILLYGMSANPPTGMQGHMGAIAHCRALGFDEVWILPVYQHIFSTKRGLAPFEHRVVMSRIAIEELPGISEEGLQLAAVDVKEYERELFEHLASTTETAPEQLRVGSIDLIRYLRERFPTASFTMLLGADTFADLRGGKWKNGDELQRLVKLLVMSRQGYEAPQPSEADAADAVGGRVRFISIPSLSDVSSTYVRSVRDPEELRRVVAPRVAEYIMQHKLYGFVCE